MSEYLKRKRLLPSEMSRVLGRMYERWREKKKYIINMNQGEVAPQERLRKI